MKGNTITWIVVGCAIFIALLWLLFTFLTPHGYDWRESYYVNDEEPFCTSVLADITETYFPNTEFEIIKNNIRTALDTSITKNKNYFFAGKSFHMNDSTIRAFLDFIDRGNDAFIAAKYFSDEFAQELFYTYEYEIPEDTLIEEEVYIEIPEDEENDIDSIFNFHEDFFQDDSYTTDNNIITTLSSQNININFVDPELSGTNGYTYIFQVQDKYEYYGWKYFTEDFIKGDTKYNVEPLGKLSSGGYNFIKIEHGRGNIYICSTPILLTNFYLIQESNLEYTSKLLSHLDEGDIVWDEFSKREYSGDYIAAQEEGPLKFILSQTSLRWAWYTIVAGVLIFIFFRSKRMQQTIPITEPNINRSLEFVQTIGRMYYLSEDKKQLIHQKMKLLQYFIKNKYKLSAASVSEDFISKLSMKSQISEQDLKYIFNTYQYLEKQFEVTDKDLMDFHNLTDTFYKTCK